MARLTFIDVAEKVLGDEQRPMSAEEIWEVVRAKGYVISAGKTPAASLSARLYVDMRDNPATKFTKAGARPRRFLLKSFAQGKTEEAISAMPVAQAQSSHGFRERDIHPFLVYFASSTLQAFCKTIRHERSRSKSSFSQWLHPDIVGLRLQSTDWRSEVTDFAVQAGQGTARLFAFELKLDLGFANLREAFFQAVSNSSWAHEGYLVAANIGQDEDFLSELKRLSDSFGIGVIRLDIEDPNASEIVYRARGKADLDWETMNKLATENPDFRDFLTSARNALKINSVIRDQFDHVFGEADVLVATLKGKAK